VVPRASLSSGKVRDLVAEQVLCGGLGIEGRWSHKYKFRLIAPFNRTITQLSDVWGPPAT